VNLDLDVRVWKTNLDHRMSRKMTLWIHDADSLICFAFLAEIIVWTNCAFIADSANRVSVVLTTRSIATNVTVFNILRRVEVIEHRGKMIVDWCEQVIRMSNSSSLDAFVAKIVVAALEALVPDTNNVLKSTNDHLVSIPFCIHHNERHVCNHDQERDGG
jgi:hypothetical protein